MDDRTVTVHGGLSAADFFALGLEGASLTAAQLGTGLAYTTVLRVRDRGSACRPQTVRRLERWSRSVPAAQAAGVWIDTARTLGLDPCGE
jgi:hypothetical protein